MTARFAFARARLAQGEWEPARRLTSGRSWWRCLGFAASQGGLHPCAERLAKHVSCTATEQVTLTNIRQLLGAYAAYHGLSLRTAWTDWGRLVEAGWLAPIRAPANQGRCHPQGPGSGRAARYVLTAPASVVDQLRAATSLDTSLTREASPSPSVPPRPQHQRRGWITLCRPTPTERRDASALLAGCHEPWRRQRPDHELLTRPDWEQLLPLVAQAARRRPGVSLTAMLTDRVRSARHLPGVLAWRLWQLLGQPPPPKSRLARLPQAHIAVTEDTNDWHQHLPAVRTLGGPAAARTALATARPHLPR